MGSIWLILLLCIGLPYFIALMQGIEVHKNRNNRPNKNTNTRYIHGE